MPSAVSSIRKRRARQPSGPPGLHRRRTALPSTGIQRPPRPCTELASLTPASLRQPNRAPPETRHRSEIGDCGGECPGGPRVRAGRADRTGQGDVLATANGEVGGITVGGLATAIPSLLVPAAGLVQRERPRLEIAVREVEMQQGLSQLGSGELDVVVAVDSAEAPTAEALRFSRATLGVDESTSQCPWATRSPGSPQLRSRR
jgi:hypothetical protein